MSLALPISESSQSQRETRPPTQTLNVIRKNAASALGTTVHHLKKHVGVGIICAVAYFDPGNWSVDMQAGSSFGYRPMLFVILMAGLGAIILQTLATRLGCVTGLDLASHCRLLLYNRTRRPRLFRILILYPLYVLSEVAIISTDLAELLGSAMGFCLIFPKLPLYAGVLLTAADVLVFLAITDPYKGQGRPVKTFEFIIIGLVFAVFICFAILLVKVKPDWSEVFMGYIPNETLVRSNPNAVYVAVGILGATVMPHALFLGSSLATQDRVSIPPPLPSSNSSTRVSFRKRVWKSLVSSFHISRTDRFTQDRNEKLKHGEWENNSLSFIRQHLRHSIFDMVSSLFCLAVPINSAILILAATVFYGGPDQSHTGPAGLFDAHDLIKARIGSGAAFVFALALIFAGQTSSVTVTLAGQLVSEGFIEWRMSPFLRRLLTRLISLIPSMVVAVAVGRKGINTLLVASQVVLSVVLPFVAFPLIYITSSKSIMRVKRPQAPPLPPPVRGLPHNHPNDDDAPLQQNVEKIVLTPIQAEVELDKEESLPPKSEEFVDFSNNKLMACLAYAIWCVVLVANAYAIVILIMGRAEE